MRLDLNEKVSEHFKMLLHRLVFVHEYWGHELPMKKTATQQRTAGRPGPQRVGRSGKAGSPNAVVPAEVAPAVTTSFLVFFHYFTTFGCPLGGSH